MKFILKVFKTFSIKTLFDISKKISIKQNKNRLLIILDMIWCGIKYKASFHDYQEFEFYNLNSKQRKTYLTRGINNKIVRLYNDKKYWHIFKEKKEFYKKFKKYIKRDIFTIETNNFNDFKNFLKNKNKIIVKPNDGEGGKGIKIIDVNNININELYNNLLSNKQLVVEEVIKQHDILDELYNKSVNSLRMFTFYDGYKVHFLQAILKIGNGNIVDNFSSGGMYTFIDENGFVKTPAIDKNDNIYEKHPITNKDIINLEIPYFKEAIELVKKASLEIPLIKYIGWDVAITNNGPIIIEGNCYPGIFQIKPSLSSTKTGILEKYKKIIKEKKL